MPHEHSLDDPFRPASPLTIPSRKSLTSLPLRDSISELLERTRIPRKFAKNRRQASYDVSSLSTTLSLCDTPGSRTPRRRTSLFDEDDPTPPGSLPESHSYLLTPPNSIPDLSRSLSSNSFDSELSTASSHGPRTAKLSSPPRETVDLESSEDPLFQSDDAWDDEFLGSSPATTPPDTPTRRRSSLSALLRPLRAVAPSLRASSVVSALSANLASWATSLANSQYDDGYGLLPSSMAQVAIPRRGSLHQDIPRPVKASGPKTGHTAIIEAEMERPLLAEEPPQIIHVELLPWSLKADTKDVSIPAQGGRQREPRMNPDFLRILVLEGNMRRLGKISPGIGRARMILSPRCRDGGESHLRTEIDA